MCSCSFFSSLPLIFTLVAAASIFFSHRHYKMFTFFFLRNWSPLFLSLALALFLLTTLMQTLKFIQQRQTRLCCFFRAGTVFEIQNFTQAYTKGWTYVRTILSEPKFLGCIYDQIFLPMVLARERALLLLSRGRIPYCSAKIISFKIRLPAYLWGSSSSRCHPEAPSVQAD